MTRGYTRHGPFNPANTPCRASSGAARALRVNARSENASSDNVGYQTLATIKAGLSRLLRVRLALLTGAGGTGLSVAVPVGRCATNPHIRQGTKSGDTRGECALVELLGVVMLARDHSASSCAPRAVFRTKLGRAGDER